MNVVRGSFSNKNKDIDIKSMNSSSIDDYHNDDSSIYTLLQPITSPNGDEIGVVLINELTFEQFENVRLFEGTEPERETQLLKMICRLDEDHDSDTFPDFAVKKMAMIDRYHILGFAVERVRQMGLLE